jgi:hypothetical protein
MKYKVTLYLEANTHPRKWIPETIWEALDDGEDILDYRIEQMSIQSRLVIENEYEGRWIEGDDDE